MSTLYYESSLAHHGIKGQKWGVRRYQNPDGTLTSAGRKHRSKPYIKDGKFDLESRLSYVGKIADDKYRKKSSDNLNKTMESLKKFKELGPNTEKVNTFEQYDRSNENINKLAKVELPKRAKWLDRQKGMPNNYYCEIAGAIDRSAKAILAGDYSKALKEEDYSNLLSYFYRSGQKPMFRLDLKKE